MEITQKHLVWVDTNPYQTLDAATWLFTVQELRKTGWDVELISPREYGKYVDSGVENTGIPMPKIYLIRQLIYHLRVIRYISRRPQKPDVILFHEISLLIFFFWRLVRWVTGKKRPLFVLDIRSLPMETKETLTFKDRLRNLYFYFGNWLANNGGVDGRVVITRYMADVLKIPEEKLWGIWTSGVQLDRFSIAAQTRDWGKINERIDIIYIGSLSLGRNLNVFCRAILLANQQGMKFTMTCVGDGDNAPELRELEKLSGGSIRVIPPVPHEQIQDWLAQAQIGVLPFPDEEKFRVSSPIKLFEYAASGLAILATRVICHTNVINEDGYVFWANHSTVDSFIACLQEIWQNKARLPGMGHLAGNAAVNWTWSASAANLSRALEQGIEKYG